jgi:multidrug efflux pump subunit AcrA (membrane-fusion protein)
MTRIDVIHPGQFAWTASLLMLVAALHCGQARGEEATGTAGMTVSVVKALKHCFENRLTASGVFEVADELQLRPDREGLVAAATFVEPGDWVVKDQVLARLVSSQNPAQEAIAVRAPDAGLVTASSVVVGAYVSANGPDPLFRVAVKGQLELKAEIPSRYLPLLRKGMKASIHVAGLPVFSGRVASVAGEVDGMSQLAGLRLSAAVDSRLRAGTFARAEIEAGEDCGLTVPLSALHYGPDGTVVATVRGDRVIMRRVVTGLLEGRNIEIREGQIREGLSEDDQVIARAGPFLREGDHVRAVLAAP